MHWRGGAPTIIALSYFQLLQVTFTRCLYAQIMSQKYEPDKRTGWNLPCINSPQRKAHELGMKLVNYCWFNTGKIYILFISFIFDRLIYIAYMTHINMSVSLVHFRITLISLLVQQI